MEQVSDKDWLVERFEAHRARLRAVAYRLLGSTSEADDAVQEAWLRVQRSDVADVHNLGGWLTTVVGRICLDMLRTRTSRREQELDVDAADGSDPERDALVADSVGLALLVVLDTLNPAERLAFVLHDIFAVSYSEIAAILDRTPNATKMLASRARRRIQNAETAPDVDPLRQRAIVRAFLKASRAGDFDALLALLHPDMVLRSDAVAAQMGAPRRVSGAARIAEGLRGRARGARPALIDGVAGAVWAQGGKLRSVFAFTFIGDKIAAIDVIAEPARLEQLDIEFLTTRV
jgi:RNA polymerase sigma-70 factor (ECF subfamily)